MKIRTAYLHYSGEWQAIDEDTFTAEYRDGAPFSNSPEGRGRTEEEAIADLKEQLEQDKGSGYESL